MKKFLTQMCIRDRHMFSLQAEFPVIQRSTLRFLFVLSFLTGLFKNKRRK